MRGDWACASVIPELVEIGGGHHGARLDSLRIAKQYVIAARGIAAASSLHRESQLRFVHGARRGHDQLRASRVPFNTDLARQHLWCTTHRVTDQLQTGGVE